MRKEWQILKNIVWILLFILLCLSPSPPNAKSNTNTMQAKKNYFTQLQKGLPEDVGISSERLKVVDECITTEISRGFPGAVLVIIKDGKIIKDSAYGFAKRYDGHSELSQPIKMKTTTIFDLASNTKMFSTNFAMQQLVSQGKVDLKQSVQYYLPAFKDRDNDEIKGKAKITVTDLLQHTAGLPSSIHYHDPKKAGVLYSQDRELTKKMVIATPLKHPPHTAQIYSDIDYMLLGMIIEEVTGVSLDDYVEKEIYKPLGLSHTKYNPLQKGESQNVIAATELFGNTRDGAISFPHIRKHTLQGEVHDEKAFYSMAGVSGHAGLFSTGREMAVLLQVMLNGGGYGNIELFNQSTINQFTTPSSPDSSFALGWRINSDDHMHQFFSESAPSTAIGHTGWTGTMTVIDKENQLGICLLTNKRHSHVINPYKNPNVFAGDQSVISNYGKVIDLIYKAIIS